MKYGRAFLIGLTLLVGIATILTPYQTASALPGGRSLMQGYFTGGYNANHSWGQVLPNGGLNYSGLTSKANFISFIKGKLSSGSTQEKTGAAFIINLMLGNDGPGAGRNPSASAIGGWEDRINNPAVTLEVRSYSFTYNSAYSYDMNDDLFYVDPQSQQSLVFNYNGVPRTVIKLDCGNPLDDLAGLPSYTPTARVQGYVVNESGAAVNAGATVSAGTASATPGTSAFFLDTSAGSTTMNITGINSTYELVGYRWEGGGTTSASSFSRTLTAGSTYDMRWVVKLKSTPTPAAWSLSGSTVRGGPSSIVAGDSVTFTHTVTKSGSGSIPSSGYSRMIMDGWFSSSSPSNTASNWENRAGDSGITGNVTVTNSPNPSSEPGRYYCQYIRYWPRSSTDSDNGRSTPACVLVNVGRANLKGRIMIADNPSTSVELNGRVTLPNIACVGTHPASQAGCETYNGSYTSDGAYLLTSNQIPAGMQDVRLNMNAFTSGYELVGFKVCRQDSAQTAEGGFMALPECTSSSTWTNSHVTSGAGYKATTDTNQQILFKAGFTYNTRWLVREKKASLAGYIVMQGNDGTYFDGVVHVASQACVGTNKALDDASCSSYGGTYTANKAFRLDGAITPGSREIFVTNIPTGFTVVGSKICRVGSTQSGIPQCPSGSWPDGAVASGTGYVAYSATTPRRTLSFGADTSYNIRWILAPNPPLCDNNVTTDIPYLDIETRDFTVTSKIPFDNPLQAQAVYDHANANYFTAWKYLQNGTTEQFIEGDQPMSAADKIIRISLDDNVITIKRKIATAPNNPGVYRYNWAMSLNGVAFGPNCGTEFTLGYKPYLAVRNGDIQLGAGMPNSDGGICPGQNSRAGIATWNRGSTVPSSTSTTNFVGAGTNFGVMTLNAVQSFASNNDSQTLNITSNPDKSIIGRSLTFANRDYAQSIYGGTYDGYQNPCIKDYWATKPATLTNLSGLNNIPAGTNASYSLTGNIDGGTIQKGTHIVIYAENNAHINGNITFAPGPYASWSDIPSLFIVAKGNITVLNGVSRLDGNYIAQGSGAASAYNGVFFSCAQASTTAPIRVNNYNSCNGNNQSLVINGSVIAKHFVLNRSYGTLSRADGTPNEANSAAEVFRYSPLTWLAPSPINGGATVQTYDSITSLPPVL